MSDFDAGHIFLLVFGDWLGCGCLADRRIDKTATAAKDGVKCLAWIALQQTALAVYSGTASDSFPGESWERPLPKGQRPPDKGGWATSRLI